MSTFQSFLRQEFQNDSYFSSTSTSHSTWRAPDFKVSKLNAATRERLDGVPRLRKLQTYKMLKNSRELFLTIYLLFFNHIFLIVCFFLIHLVSFLTQPFSFEMSVLAWSPFSSLEVASKALVR